MTDESRNFENENSSRPEQSSDHMVNGENAAQDTQQTIFSDNADINAHDQTHPAENASPEGTVRNTSEHSSYAAYEYSGAGVGEKTTFEAPSAHTQDPPHITHENNSQAQQTNPHADASHTNTSAPSNKAKQKKKEKKGIGAGTVALLLIVCILVSGASGVGGAYLYKTLSGTTNGTVVVNKVESNGTPLIEAGSLSDIIAQVSDTVVEIRTEQVVTGTIYGNYVSEGAGSGVIISDNGYIITNNHVISGANTISVRTKDGTEYDATLISTDSQTDVAVIKVEASGLHAATIGSSADLVVGQRVIAIGNPLGELGGSVTQGIISALDREVTVEGTKMTLMQTDAAINPGNSGGGLFNANGELIGIVNAKSSGDSIEGLGFAIPIDTAYTVAEELIENGHVSGRPALGISAIKISDSNDYYKYYYSEIGKYIDSYGVYVYSDTQDNFKVGDRIIAIDGTSVSDMEDISEILSGHEIGDVVSVTVSRDRQMLEVSVTLIEKTA